MMDILSRLDENNCSHTFLEGIFNKHRKNLDIFKEKSETTQKKAAPLTWKTLAHPHTWHHTTLRHREGFYTEKHKLIELDLNKIQNINENTEKKAENLLYKVAFQTLSESALQSTRRLREALGEGVAILAETQIKPEMRSIKA
jgi:hypothetical protein